MKKLVIFDLDGTLLNTIADLANSTNHALIAHGFNPHPTESYRFFVGNGINKLFERALPEEAKTEENILRIRETFLEHYDRHNTDFSTPYPGIPEMLHILQQEGLLLAVASNKYQSATTRLVAHYFSEIHFAVVLGQRENIPTKPHPHIIDEIAELTQVPKTNILYVGDSGVDMQTALNAGVESIGVTWGFRPREELESFNPAHFADKAEDIVHIATAHNI